MLIEIDKNYFINIINVYDIYGKRMNNSEEFYWTFYDINDKNSISSKNFKNEDEARKWLFNVIEKIKE